MHSSRGRTTTSPYASDRPSSFSTACRRILNDSGKMRSHGCRGGPALTPQPSSACLTGVRAHPPHRQRSVLSPGQHLLHQVLGGVGGVLIYSRSPPWIHVRVKALPDSRCSDFLRLEVEYECRMGWLRFGLFRKVTVGFLCSCVAL